MSLVAISDHQRNISGSPLNVGWTRLTENIYKQKAERNANLGTVYLILPSHDVTACSNVDSGLRVKGQGAEVSTGERLPSVFHAVHVQRYVITRHLQTRDPILNQFISFC